MDNNVPLEYQLIYSGKIEYFDVVIRCEAKAFEYTSQF